VSWLGTSTHPEPWIQTLLQGLARDYSKAESSTQRDQRTVYIQLRVNRKI
jgi:hypothetical protein